MTDDQTSGKGRLSSKSGHPQGKSKRKVVVSHTPLKGKKTDEAIQFGSTEAKIDAAYEEEALLASLHKSASTENPEPSTFSPVDPIETETKEEPLTMPRKSSAIPMLFSFIALVGTGVIAYLGVQLYFKVNGILNTQMSEKFDSLETQTQVQTQTLQLLEARLAKEAENNANIDKTQTAQLDTLQSQLTATQKNLSLAGRNEQGWVLAEAQYLVRAANERLKAFQDIETAVYQLQAADNRLKELADPTLLQVREAIAKDIAALQAIQKPDRDGIWLTLGQLETQIEQLPFVTVTQAVNNEAPVEKKTIDSNLPGWQRAGLSAWNEIKGLVRIKHHDEDFQFPVLSNQEGAILRHAISLQIAEARLAVLQGNNTVYRGSLDILRRWVEQYFETGTARQTVLKELDKLEEAKITVSLPDVNDALNGINAALNQQTRVLFAPMSKQQEANE